MVRSRNMSDRFSEEAVEQPWVLTYEKATPLHIGPSKVIVNGEEYVLKNVMEARLLTTDARLLKALVAFYRVDPGHAARLCDEDLDTSGALLGLVREVVNSQPEETS